MNPITWTMTLRETAEERPLAAPPPDYEPASYSRRDIWRDSGIYYETYQRDNPPTPYSQRRLVDRLHYGFPFGTETIQLNSTGQDYPLCNLPPRVVSALERLEPGASRKNVVDMTPAQRQIVLDDAKAHTLGYLYFLQHDHPKAETRARMRRFALTDEFGTPDRLPPKPYVREGLRLAALYVLREQDVRAPDGAEPGWAPFRPDDAAFSFQFHIDFHPTRRFFDVKDKPDAWHARHCGTRGWNGKTHRAFFPLRALVPENWGRGGTWASPASCRRRSVSTGRCSSADRRPARSPRRPWPRTARRVPSWGIPPPCTPSAARSCAARADTPASRSSRGRT